MRVSTAQQEALRTFAVRVIVSADDDELDGEVAIEFAIDVGLMKKDSATQTDCDNGFHGNLGDILYRMVSWLEAP